MKADCWCLTVSVQLMNGQAEAFNHLVSYVGIINFKDTRLMENVSLGRGNGFPKFSARKSLESQEFLCFWKKL